MSNRSLSECDIKNAGKRTPALCNCSFTTGSFASRYSRLMVTLPVWPAGLCAEDSFAQSRGSKPSTGLQIGQRAPVLAGDIGVDENFIGRVAIILATPPPWRAMAPAVGFSSLSLLVFRALPPVRQNA
jgi:hypothetical protein